MFDLSAVVNNPDLGSPVTILRFTGSFAAGGWQQGAPQRIPAFGVVCIADAEALAQVPEGDRVTGALQFLTGQPVYRTSADRGGTSDQIEWRGELYRVVSVEPWGHAGYWSAILARMEGA